MRLVTTVFAIVAFLLPVSAMASSIDFEDPIEVQESEVVFPGATLTNLDGYEVFLYRSGEFGMPEGGGFCALSPGFECRGDTLLAFESPVNNLMFESFFVALGDRASLEIYRGDELLSEVRVDRQNTKVDLSEFGDVTSIFFDSRSTRAAAGLAYGAFTFEVAEVPLPPALPAFALALGVLFLARRRQRRNISGANRI